MEPVHICVIGDAFVDVLACPLDRMPSWGADVDCASISQHPGGSALNVAIHLGELVRGSPHTCSFYGLVGDDEFGKFLRSKLAKANVLDRLQSSSDPDASTGVCIVLSGSNDRGFVTHVGATSKLGVAHLQEVLQADCKRSRLHVHVSGFYSCPALQQDLPEFLDALREEATRNSCKLSISLDTNGDASDMWDGGVVRVLERVDFFLPNEVEAVGIAKKLLGSGGDNGQQLVLEDAAQTLAQKVREAAVITCGKEGCISQTRAGVSAGAAPGRWSAPAGISPVDATGAACWFAEVITERTGVRAVVTVSMMTGSLANAIQAGSCTGAYCTQHKGANSRPMSSSELQDMVREKFSTC